MHIGADGNVEDENYARAKKPIKRGQGVTPAERYLQGLAERSFLKFWSHPCVFQRPGRELCDLLVVFGNDILIFSDKNCEFRADISMPDAWRRWFKSAVLEGAKQIWGAERWIKNFPDRLFLDAKCKQPFPFRLPSLNEARFHRIVVAHGAASACQRFFHGGSGSLIINSKRLGIDHLRVEGTEFLPFTVGRIDPQKGFVHVFDDTSLDAVMRTLDTAPDFIAYLNKKASLIEGEKIVAVAGEEELLALYLRNVGTDGSHHFDIPADVNGIFIEEGHWRDLQDHPRRRAQIDADRISYAWDELIERFSHHILAGTQEFSSVRSASESEISLRILAKENRLRRRMLAEGLVHVAKTASPSRPYTRVYRGLRPSEPFYVLLGMSAHGLKDESTYRAARRTLLEGYCLACKDQYAEALDIVGIAISASCDHNCSEDLIYLDTREWSEANASAAKALRKEFQLLKDPKEVRGTYQEYPDIPSPMPVSQPPVRLGRNDPCYCGSGKKYKKCHLK
jgi:hypothetical protein